MSTALVRYDQEKPRGLLGRLRGAMQKWTLSQGGPELEARLARLVAPQNEYGVDPFGLELDFVKTAIAPVLWLYRNYFRDVSFQLVPLNLPPGGVYFCKGYAPTVSNGCFVGS